jgi:hypothetical protein
MDVSQRFRNAFGLDMRSVIGLCFDLFAGLNTPCAFGFRTFGAFGSRSRFDVAVFLAGFRALLLRG